jgi:hypothetical protein
MQEGGGPSSEKAARDLRAKGFGSGFSGSIPRCRSASVAVVAPLVKSTQAAMETGTTLSVTRQQVVSPAPGMQLVMPKPPGKNLGFV